MSTTGPGWLDEPEHDEPVELAEALAEWTSRHLRPDAEQDSEAGQ